MSRTHKIPTFMEIIVKLGHMPWIRQRFASIRRHQSYTRRGTEVSQTKLCWPLARVPVNIRPPPEGSALPLTATRTLGKEGGKVDGKGGKDKHSNGQRRRPWPPT